MTDISKILLDIYEELEDLSWETGDDYHTVPIDELLDSDVAVCWDFVNYQHYRLDQLGIENHSYLIIYDTEDGPLSHSWSTVMIDDRLWWLECSWGNHEGIYPIDSYQDVVDKIVSEYPPLSEVLLYEYDPDGLDNRLSPDEFVSRVKRTGTRIRRCTNAG